MNDHKCPVIRCSERVPYERLMCSRHWAQVPADIRARIETKYRENLPEAHARAVRDAIKSLLPEEKPNDATD